MPGDRCRETLSVIAGNCGGCGEVEERRSPQRHEPRRALAEICPSATKTAGCGSCGVSGDGGGLLFSRELAVAGFCETCGGGPANFSGYLAFPQPFDRFIHRLAGAKLGGNAEHWRGTVQRPPDCFPGSAPSNLERSARPRECGFRS